VGDNYFHCGSAVATLALVGTSIVQHSDTQEAIKETTRIARSAEGLLIASERAWLSCNPIFLDRDITFDKNGAAFYPGCVFNNTGHSPARDVLFMAAAFPLPGAIPNFDRNAEQRRVCKLAETTNAGMDVFPNETVSGGTIAMIPPSKLQPIMVPVLVTCVAYRIIGDEKYHHTPRMFSLVREGKMIISPSDGTIPKSEIKFTIFPVPDVSAD
jgi:hypothetical protein